MNATIRLATNERKLISNLGFAFSNNTTFLSELAQNARRAGASFVAFELKGDDLVVTDDGSGISDFQNLFTVAESGWDAEVQVEERPFGMGFVSALFACSAITIESCGATLSAATAAVLKQDEVDVIEGDVTVGTRLTLHGLQFDSAFVPSALVNIARGFAIPVHLDGKPLPRPFALDASGYIDSPVGAIRVPGLGNSSFETHRYIAFLQGVEVARGSKHSSAFDVVVHLDSKAFRAQLPDRHQLIDAEAQIAKVQDAIKTVVAAELRKKHDAVGAEEFVRFYWEQALKYAAELLSDIPFAPLKLFKKPIAVLWNDSGNWYDAVTEISDDVHYLVPQGELESGKRRAVAGGVFAEIDTDGLSALRLAYVIAHSGIVMTQAVPDNHWTSSLPAIDEIDLTYEVVDALPEISIRGICDAGFLVPCKQILVKGPWGDVCIDSHELAVTDDQGITRIYSPEGTKAVAEGVRQVQSFTNEHDRLDTDYRDEVEAQLAALIGQARGAAPKDVLQNALRDVFVNVDSVCNKRYVVAVNERGRLSVMEVLGEAGSA
ncbi:ATP-binding protein [Burkholderia sp. Ac-20365]|uniref:ATP-binding protein n=1 Tax=Burkholderia sp. Ac-20365 TaxID=2703897 RepID=UPI00197B7798|nr:ATP-binding protein [Burkholderia sp. Ac-20365]